MVNLGLNSAGSSGIWNQIVDAEGGATANGWKAQSQQKPPETGVGVDALHVVVNAGEISPGFESASTPPQSVPQQQQKGLHWFHAFASRTPSSGRFPGQATRGPAAVVGAPARVGSGVGVGQTSPCLFGPFHN